MHAILQVCVCSGYNLCLLDDSTLNFYILAQVTSKTIGQTGGGVNLPVGKNGDRSPVACRDDAHVSIL